MVYVPGCWLVVVAFLCPLASSAIIYPIKVKCNNGERCHGDISYFKIALVPKYYIGNAAQETSELNLADETERKIPMEKRLTSFLRMLNFKKPEKRIRNDKKNKLFLDDFFLTSKPPLTFDNLNIKNTREILDTSESKGREASVNTAGNDYHLPGRGYERGNIRENYSWYYRSHYHPHHENKKHDEENKTEAQESFQTTTLEEAAPTLSYKEKVMSRYSANNKPYEVIYGKGFTTFVFKENTNGSEFIRPSLETENSSENNSQNNNSLPSKQITNEHNIDYFDGFLNETNVPKSSTRELKNKALGVNTNNIQNIELKQHKIKKNNLPVQEGELELKNHDFYAVNGSTEKFLPKFPDLVNYHSLKFNDHRHNFPKSMNYNGRLMTANENLQFGSQKEHLNEQGSGNRQNSKLHIFTNQNQKHREFSPPLPSSCVSCLSREFGILRPIFLNERSKEFNRTHVTRPGSFLNNRKSTTSNLNKENKRTGNSFFIDKPFQHGSVSSPEDHQVSQIFHSNSASKEFPSSYFQNNSSDEILKSPQKFRSNSSHRNIVEQERVSQAYQGQFQSFHTVLFTPSSHSIPPEDRISQGRSVQYTGTPTIPSNQPFKNALSGEKITQDLSRKHQSPQTFRDNPSHRTIPTRKSLPQDNSEQYEDFMVVQPNLSENVALRDPSKQYQYSRTVPSNPSFQNTPSKKSISQGYPGHNQGPQTGQPNLSLQNIGSQGRIRQHQGLQSSQFNPSSQNTLTQVNPLKNRPEYHHERFSSFNKNNQFQLFNQGLKTGFKESKNPLKFRTNKFTNIAKPNQQNTILLRQPDILSTDSFENSNLNENSPHNNEELSEQPNTPTFPSSFQEKKLETGFGEAQGMRNLDRIRVFQSNGRLSSVFNPASEQQILLQTEKNIRGSSKNKLEINEGNKQTVKENFDENSKLFDTSVHSTLNNENVRGSKSDLKQEMIVRLNSIVKQNDNKNLASPETFGISKMVLNGEERLKNNSNSFSNTNILDQKAVSISDFQQNSNHFQKGIRNSNSINSGKEEVLLTDFERENEKHSEQAGQSLFPNQGMSVPINNHEFRQNFARIPDDNSHQDKGDEELEEFVNGRHSVPSRHWEDPGPTDETWERSRPMDNRDPWWQEDPWNNEPEPWRYENPRDNNLESRWHDEMWDNDPNPWGDTRDPWWQENPRHINRNPWWQDDPWKNEPYQPWKINDNSQGKRGMCWKNHNKKNYHKGFMQNRRHFSGKNKWYQQYNQKMNGWNRIMWQRKPFSIWQMFKLMG